MGRSFVLPRTSTNSTRSIIFGGKRRYQLPIACFQTKLKKRINGFSGLFAILGYRHQNQWWQVQHIILWIKNALSNLDFESAPIKALSDVYGDIDLSKCCLFHLSKNAFANIQTKGLLLAYANEDAKMYFRSLVSLAFLPLSEVLDGFDELSLKLNSLPIFEQLSLVDNLARKLIYSSFSFLFWSLVGVVICYSCLRVGFSIKLLFAMCDASFWIEFQLGVKKYHDKAKILRGRC